jgi:hypothetical protein
LVDNKPGTNDPVLWLIDFGLAGDIKGGRKLQATHVTHRVYIRAPEMTQYIEEGSVAERIPSMQQADIYSLGVVIFWVSITRKSHDSLSRLKY